jgi:hypothetical protein
MTEKDSEELVQAVSMLFTSGLINDAVIVGIIVGSGEVTLPVISTIIGGFGADFFKSMLKRSIVKNDFYKSIASFKRSV